MQWLVKFTCLILLSVLSFTSIALDIDLSRYKVYEADLNGDGKLDYYFQGKQLIIPIHGDIMIPIVLPAPASLKIYSYGNQYFTPVEESFSETELLIKFLQPSSASSASLQTVIANAVVPRFDFNSHAPAEFKYSLTTSGIPDLGTGQLVATTQGALSINNGATNYSVALDLPPAVRDLKPQLALTYNSRTVGNGVMGVGWNVTGLSAITRCRTNFATEGVEAQKSNPRYTVGDRLCLDGQKLVVASSSAPKNDADYWATGVEYKTELDNFAKIVAYGSSANGGHSYFKAWTKDGRILTYGAEENSQASKAYAPNQDAGPIKSWALDKVEDNYGNSYTITYDRDAVNGEHYPSQINLGTTGLVVFSYQSRNGQTPWGYDVGHKYQFTKVLDRVTTYLGTTTASPIKEYDIDYKLSATTNRELVEKIYECGYESGTRKCARPLTFDWQEGELGFESTAHISPYAGVLYEDFNGDGYVDIIGEKSVLAWGNASGGFTATNYALAQFIYVIQTRQGKAAIKGVRRTQGSTEYLDVYLSRMAPSSPMTDVLITSLKRNFQNEPIVRVADLNIDRLGDLVIQPVEFDTQPGNRFWIQQSNATFTKSAVSGAYVSGPEVSYIDVNADGLLDQTYVAYHGLHQGIHNNRLYAHTNSGSGFNGTLKSLERVGSAAQSVMMPGGSQAGPQPNFGFWRTWVDINGDGNFDVLYNDSHSVYQWAIRLSTASTQTPSVQPLISTQIFGVPMGHTSGGQFSFVIDYNKDGLDDIVVFTGEPTPWGVRYPRVFYASYVNGTLSFIDGGVDPFMGKFDYLVGLSSIPASQTPNPIRGDFNNDGIFDFFVGNEVYLGKQQQPDLINKITDGFGAIIELSYSPLTGTDNNGAPLYTVDTTTPVFPLQHISRAMQVVKKLSTSNGQQGFNHTYFNYAGGLQDVFRGFSGFKSITTTNTSTGVTSIAEYRQDWPYTGRIKKQTTKDTSGKLISVVDNGYALHSQNTRYPYLSYSLQKNYQLSTTTESAPLGVSKSINTFDACGNLTGQTMRVGTGFSGIEVTGELSSQVTVNAYDYGIEGCNDDFLTTSTQQIIKTGIPAIKRVVTEFIPNAQRDLKTRTDFKDTSIQVSTTYDRYTNGVIYKVTEVAKDIDGTNTPERITNFSDFSRGMYPQTITNPENHQTSFTYDERFGSVKTQTFLGLVTTNTYDPFGRLQSQLSVDGTLSENITFYCASAPVTCPTGAVYGVASRVTNSAQPGKLGEPLSITFYDVLQREMRSVVYSLDGKVVNKVNQYTANGDLSRISEPYATDGIIADSSFATAWTTFSDYDALGRANTISAPDGGSKTTAYSTDGYGFKTTESVVVIKPTGGSETQIASSWTNALGQITRVEDALLNTVSYVYDPTGNLESTQVNNNFATKVDITHDVAGNKTYIKDPDAGRIHFDFNGFGELRRQTWRKGVSGSEKHITYDYDKLGRQISKFDQPAIGSAIPSIWVWDTKQQGQLSYRSTGNFHEEYFYDGFSRLSRQIVTSAGLGDGEFVYTYDNFSRPETVRYPNGYKIQRDYHAAGYQVQTRDITSSSMVLWAMGNTVDARGNFNNQLWGNGVVTRTGFDSASGRLTSIKSGSLSSSNSFSNLFGDIQNLSYSYDTLGNLATRTTARTNANGVALENLTESHGYDKLNRLKTVTTSGLFARVQTFDYDVGGLGNLINRSDVLSGSSVNNDVGELKYEQVRGAGLHAVTSAGGVNYSYDGYGNMTTRGNKTITYDVFNKPTSIFGGGSFSNFYYDPDHELYKEIHDNKTIFKLAGGIYEVLIEGSTITQKSYVDGVVLNTRTLVSNIQSSNDTVYLHTDHLGSVESTTSALGQFVNRMSFGAWGERQKSDWKPGNPTESFSTLKGFTGHDQLDNHNLIHMGGRVYDPNLGRFLSADIYIQSPYNTQSYNRYSYTFNNPLSYTDPTGYMSDMMGYFMNQYYHQSMSWSWANSIYHSKSYQYEWRWKNDEGSLTAIEINQSVIDSARSFFTGPDFSGNSLEYNRALCSGGANGACTAATQQSFALGLPGLPAGNMGPVLIDTAIEVADRVATRGLGNSTVAVKDAKKAQDALNTSAKVLSKEEAKSIRSYEKRIAEHKQKIKDFKENPTIRPGMEKLSKEAIEKQWERRVLHLEREIKAFENNISKILKG